MHNEILQPVVSLIGWSLVMWGWLYTTRLPALSRAVPDMRAMVGTTGADIRALLAGRAQWPADNYNHLLEQPTLFYAVALVLQLTGAGTGHNVALAWAYVVLRIVHSLIQVLSNRVVVRFAVFALSTLPLIALTVDAALTVFR